MIFIFLVQVRLRSTTHPKFDPTGVQTHDLQNMDITFHVPEMLAVTTEPWGTFCHFKHWARSETKCSWELINNLILIFGIFHGYFHCLPIPGNFSLATPVSTQQVCRSPHYKFNLPCLTLHITKGIIVLYSEHWLYDLSFPAIKVLWLLHTLARMRSTMGSVVKASVSGIQNVLSWSGGHGF